MIGPADADFHQNDPSLTTWAETIGFWFAVPEEAIYGNIYVLARPNVGACISSVNVVQGLNRHPFTADLTDPQMHAPCPDSMMKFALPSGLTVDVDDAPTGYRFTYANIGGSAEIELRLAGSMPAWDPHDPADNPLLEASDEHQNLGLGDAWAGGHLDFLGRVRGHLVLRGRRYEVNSMAGMDRSWGTRTEFGPAAISYLHIPFDESFGIHLVTGLDLVGGETRYGPLRFGYVLDEGEVYGITRAAMSGGQQGLQPMWNRVTVTDTRGREHTVHGQAVAGAPWYTFSPSYVAFQSLMRYELDGRVGHGLQSDTFGIEFLAERLSRHGGGQSQYYGPGI